MKKKVTPMMSRQLQPFRRFSPSHPVFRRPVFCLKSLSRRGGGVRDYISMAQSPLDKPSLTEQRSAGRRGRSARPGTTCSTRIARGCGGWWHLRLDRRLQGRLDPSDVIQEAFLDATAGLANFVAKQEMPFFLWLRWLTGLRLTTLHRQHLGCRIRDAAREVSLERAAMPGASSAALAAHLLGRDTSASAVAMRLERKARIQEAIDALEPTRPRGAHPAPL